MTQDPVPASTFLKLLEYWQISLRFKWMIVGIVASSVLGTGIISKLSPKVYEAKATTMPIKEESLSGGGISFGGGGKDSKGGGGGGGGGGGLSMDVFGGKSGPSLLDTLLVLVNSRVMAEAIVERMNLFEYYGTSSKTDAAYALRGEVIAKGTSSKTLEVTVMTKDSKMAADIANTYLTELDIVYKNYNISNTKRNRVFLEARLAEKAKLLEEAEETVKAFQEKYRFISGSNDETGAQTYGMAAGLHAQILSLELELAALKEYATPNHPLINSLNVQIRELRKQLDRLEKDQLYGFLRTMKSVPPLSSKLFPTFEEAPTLALEFLRISRRVKVEETVFGMLVGMLEQAKLAEVRDLPVVLVLDSALPPLHWSKPKTRSNMMVAGVVSLLVAIILAVLLDYLEQLKLQDLQSRPKGRAKRDIDPASPSGNGHREGAAPVPSKEIEVGYRAE